MGPYEHCFTMNSKQQLSLPTSRLDLRDFVKTLVVHLGEVGRNCQCSLLKCPQVTSIYYLLTLKMKVAQSYLTLSGSWTIWSMEF